VLARSSLARRSTSLGDQHIMRDSLFNTHNITITRIFFRGAKIGGTFSFPSPYSFFLSRRDLEAGGGGGGGCLRAGIFAVTQA
jgi:hypothetical protein